MLIFSFGLLVCLIADNTIDGVRKKDLFEKHENKRKIHDIADYEDSLKDEPPEKSTPCDDVCVKSESPSKATPELSRNQRCAKAKKRVSWKDALVCFDSPPGSPENFVVSELSPGHPGFRVELEETVGSKITEEKVTIVIDDDGSSEEAKRIIREETAGSKIAEEKGSVKGGFDEETRNIIDDIFGADDSYTPDTSSKSVVSKKVEQKPVTIAAEGSSDKVDNKLDLYFASSKSKIIGNSFGVHGNTLGTVRCDGKLCKIVGTKGDGHCYYHAIAISIAFSRNPRHQVYSSQQLLDYNTGVILNDVFNIYNQISSMYGLFGGADSNLNDDKKILWKSREPVNKVVAIRRLVLNDCCANTISTWRMFDEDSPQILFLHALMLYLSYPALYSSALNSVDLFRQLTTVPGISYIDMLNPRSASGNAGDRFNKNSVCVVYHGGVHYSGLDCREKDATVAPAAEVNFETDNNILEQIDMNTKVFCGKMECSILKMRSTTSNYYDALLQSLQSFANSHEIEASLTTNTLVQKAMISMNILGDIYKFIGEFNRFKDHFQQHTAHNVPLFRYVTPNEVNQFVTVLRNMFQDKFCDRVRSVIDHKQKADQFMRQFIFYIYTYANNLGTHTDPLAKRIQEKVELEGVSEIKTISDTSRGTYEDVNQGDGNTVCVYEAHVLGHKNVPKCIYLGVKCDN